MSNYSKELKTAKEAAREASGIIRNYMSGRSFDVEFKGKNDLVTDADLEAERAILNMIEHTFPGDQVMAEETAQKRQLPRQRTWLIDPIDGTTNFAHGFPVFCVSIALWEDEEPKMGIVLEVNSNELYSAIAGEGAFLNGNKIRVSPLSDPANALIGTGFPYNDLSLVDNYIRLFKWLMYKTQGVRRPGAAAYDLCCVAAGRFDGFYEYSLNAWDVGAAALFIREAGGIVTDWEGGDNWLFGQRLVAGNPGMHAFLLEAIREHFTEEELKGVDALP